MGDTDSRAAAIEGHSPKAEILGNCLGPEQGQSARMFNLNLGHWMPPGGDVSPQRTLAMSADNFGYHNRKCQDVLLYLVGTEPRDAANHPTRDKVALPQRTVQPQIPVQLRLHNWFKQFLEFSCNVFFSYFAWRETVKKLNS